MCFREGKYIEGIRSSAHEGSKRRKELTRFSYHLYFLHNLWNGKADVSVTSITKDERKKNVEKTSLSWFSLRRFLYKKYLLLLSCFPTSTVSRPDVQRNWKKLWVSITACALKSFCASKLLSRKLFSSSVLFAPSLRLNLFLHFEASCLILSLCCGRSREVEVREKSVCILNRMRFGIFMCFLCSTPTMCMTLVLLRKWNAFVCCLFMNSPGRQFKQFALLMARLLVFQRARRQNSLANSAEAAQPWVCKRW